MLCERRLTRKLQKIKISPCNPYKRSGQMDELMNMTELKIVVEKLTLICFDY